MFNIYATKYNIHEDSFEIYISGCKGKEGVHCKGCHNPDLWNEDIGIPWKTALLGIEQTIKDVRPLVSSIRIYGGEPLEKDKEDLRNFLISLSNLKLPIWLFTRFELDEVPEEILTLLDYIKCGSYEESLSSPHEEFGVVLATSNQHIFKLKEEVGCTECLLSPVVPSVGVSWSDLIQRRFLTRK